MDFSNLNVLVTGASTGLGKTLCDILHSYGADVIGVYNTHKVEALYDMFKCDISNEIEVKKLFEDVQKRHEKIDVLVNVAALTMDNDIYDKSKEEFMRVLEVNLVGSFLMCKYASLVPELKVIINISSTDASSTYSVLSMDYASSKAGLENLTKNLAQRFPNLKVCALSPNWINTQSVLDMEPNYLKEELKRINQKELLKKEDVALKIIEMIINDDIRSGEIIKMGDVDE